MNAYMDIKDAKWVLLFGTDEKDSITCKVDGIAMGVPLVEGNRHYDEIMRQVADGKLTIADAD
jgi:hypothetical protein